MAHDLRNEVLESVSKMDPELYAKLRRNSSKFSHFKRDVDSTIGEIYQTVDSVKRSTASGRQLRSLDCLTHLSPYRIGLITSTFRNQTYVMSVPGVADPGFLGASMLGAVVDTMASALWPFNATAGSSDMVTCTRKGKDFLPPVPVVSLDAILLQRASVVIEVVILVLNIVGFSVPENETATRAALAEAKKALKKIPALIKDIQELEKAYQKSDYLRMAKVIIRMAITLYFEGVLVMIARALLSEMEWYDWLLTIAKIAAFIVATTSTGTAAQIAEIIRFLLDATDFVKKLANLIEMEKHTKK